MYWYENTSQRESHARFGPPFPLDPALQDQTPLQDQRPGQSTVSGNARAIRTPQLLRWIKEGSDPPPPPKSDQNQVGTVSFSELFTKLSSKSIPTDIKLNQRYKHYILPYILLCNTVHTFPTGKFEFRLKITKNTCYFSFNQRKKTQFLESMFSHYVHVIHLHADMRLLYILKR